MEGKVSLEERFQMHRDTSVKFKTAMKDMGFKLVSRARYMCPLAGPLTCGLTVASFV